MKALTTAPLLRKKITLTDWHDNIMHRILANTEEYDIPDEVLQRQVSVLINEALGDFGQHISDRISKDLKKNYKRSKSAKKPLGYMMRLG